MIPSRCVPEGPKPNRAVWVFPRTSGRVRSSTQPRPAALAIHSAAILGSACRSLRAAYVPDQHRSESEPGGQFQWRGGRLSAGGTGASDSPIRADFFDALRVMTLPSTPEAGLWALEIVCSLSSRAVLD